MLEGGAIMEDSAAQKRKQQEFALASVSEVSSAPSSASPGVALFAGDRLQIRNESHRVALNAHLSDIQLFRLGPIESVCMVEGSEADKQTSYSSGVAIQFRNEEESEAFHCVFQQWKKGFDVQGGNLPNGTDVITSKSKFDEKIEPSSAKMYFHYYGQLLHQQNMLQDYVRTGTYYAAVLENRADFVGRVVVDVGAGSGILSLFAAQAGAKHVYAVEASEMAEYARKLVAGNPILGQRITVIKGKVEDVELPEKADILISEPMGTLLVNERMLESYVIARDRFLIPNGKMFPTVGRIHMAPFSDEYLFVEIANKALFWQQQNYYGVDLTPLHGTAFQGYFSQPVVDAFDPRLLIAAPMFHVLDFTKIKEEELYEIDIPLRFTATVGARLHGLACWFDVLFNGSTARRWLTTAPGSPTTHWYQLRCVLSQPIYVMAGQEITGRMHLIAHTAQSYTIFLTLSAKTWGPGAEQGGILQTSSCKLDLKEPYYRMSQPQAYPLAQDQQPQPLLQTQDIHIQSQELDEVEMMQQPSTKSCAHSSTPPPNTFLPFDPYNPSSHHLLPSLQTNHLLHPPTTSPTHKHEQDKVIAPIVNNNEEIQRDQRQLPDQLTDSWTNDEVLALFRIRSSMENWLPELTWDHVSRRLAEVGFKKSAEKCKEKFEDESRYFDNINNYGKNNFRFLISELEELCQNSDPGAHDHNGVVVRSEKTHHLGGHALEENSRDIETTTATKRCDIGSDTVVEKSNSKVRKRKRRDRFEMFKGFCESVVNKMMAQQEETHNKLLEDMVKRDQEKFAREEAWKKQELDRMKKELEIMAQEQAIAGDRQATIIEFLKKCATTTITSLSPPSQNAKYYITNDSNLPNCASHSQNPNNPSNEDNNLEPTPSSKMIQNHGQTTLGAENPSTSDTLLQVPSSSNSSPTTHNPSSSLNSHNNIIPLESNSVSTYKPTSTTPMASSENSKDDIGRRWPRDEVLALINLRCTSLSSNEEKEGNKGPLWERISQGMSALGYKRSAKRCKEKWENINKYFRKTKDNVNKKRSLNSRTCPYFHQLSCLYGQGKIVPQSEREGNYCLNPTPNSGQVPPDDDHQVQDDESSQVGSAGLVQYAC